MAVLFNGVNQWMQIAAPRPELAGKTEFTLCYWFRVPSETARRMAISFSTGTSTSANRCGFGTGPAGPQVYMTWYLRRSDAGVEERADINLDIITQRIGKNTFFAGSKYATGWVARLLLTAPSPFFFPLNLGTVSGPMDATASLAAAIGARADGLAEYFNGYVEDMRLYSRELSNTELLKIGIAQGRDLRANMHPDLLLRWRLKGHGAVGTEVDQVSGVAATAVNGPGYAQNATYSRRRNRGG